MKAVICPKYGPPEVLQLAEVPTPEPADHEVLIKTYAATVTVADFRLRSFTVPLSFWVPARLMLGIFKPKKPILGMEVAGVVEAVGKDVQRFQPGDAVISSTLPHFGGYAEFVCVPEHGPIVHKPSSLSFGEAAALPIGGRTAFHFLQKAQLQPGQKVLVYGASGSVGTYTVQLAKHGGAEVTGVCSQGNFEMVRAQGADQVIDYRSDDFPDQLEQYDVVFIAVDKCPFSIANKALKPGGMYINITQPMPTPAMIWTNMTTAKKITVGENLPETADELRAVKELVDAGKMWPVIDRTYPLEAIVEAHQYVDQGHKKGNVVIQVREELEMA